VAHPKQLSISALAVVAWIALAPAGSAQAPPAAEAAALAEFQERIAEYVTVHTAVAGRLPPLRRTDDAAEIATREVALGEGIAAARSRAQRGDVITAEASRILRRLIKRDFRTRSTAERKLMMDEIPNFRPRVNQVYPSVWPLATFPATLLKVMPALPEVLEYRLLSEALILRDVKANIVVDFILDVY
jgi:hypothetical protein